MLNVLLYKYCHINFRICFIVSFARLTIGTMVSLYKTQVSAFAKDSETEVLWMISLRSKRFLSNCLHEKKRSGHTFKKKLFCKYENECSLNERERR